MLDDLLRPCEICGEEVGDILCEHCGNTYCENCIYEHECEEEQ
jgi:hypothetical protein